MNSFPQDFVVKDGRVFTIDLVRLDESEEVVEFRKHNFSSISPLCYLVKDRNEPSDETSMRNYVSEYVKDPVSLAVRDSTGRLVAIVLNKLLEKSEACEQAAITQSPRLIMSLLHDLEHGIDLFTTYNTKKVFALGILSVDQKYGRLGLATKLVNLSLELAKANGAGAVKCSVVSQHAAKAAIKNGLETIRTIDYATYEFNGNKPLAKFTDLLAEHSLARFMTCHVE
jgi:hypothetical protein